MATVAESLRQVLERIARAAERASRSPDEVTLVAITKAFPASAIRTGYEAGLRHFGENYVQEAALKQQEVAALRPHITWHMVGHLQTNKAKTALQIFDIIHSVDSLRVAQALSRSAQGIVPVLLQINVAGEATKEGFASEEAMRAVEAVANLPHLELRGLMTVAPLVTDPEEVRPVFRRLRELRDALGLKELSMGMTDDYEVAVEEGATLVRLGRALFGDRPAQD